MTAQIGTGFDYWLETVFLTERPRLVLLCVLLSGDATAAEDLAQQTLLVAWQCRHNLTDPSGHKQWFSAIARNLCLSWSRQRRYENQRWVDIDFDSLAERLTDGNNFSGLQIESRMESYELVSILNQTLECLSPAARSLLFEKYVYGTKTVELARQLSMTEGTVTMRLQRAKLLLKQELTKVLHETESTTANEDQMTRIWCPHCGQHRLAGKLDNDAGKLLLRCPHCCGEEHVYITQAHIPNLFKDLIHIKAALSRVVALEYNYYSQAMRHHQIECTFCARILPVRVYYSEDSSAYRWDRHVIDTSCGHCASQRWTLLSSYNLCLPQVHHFWRKYERIQQGSEYCIEYEGQPAIVKQFQSVRTNAVISVVSSQATYVPLHIIETPSV